MGVRKKEISAGYDVVIVGGGLTGLCAAIAAGREGARTALVQDRPVLGGNGSSEIRMHVCDASDNNAKKDAMETGILHELMLENKANNDFFNFSVWDSVLLEKLYKEPNVTLYLNTSMNDVDVEERTIRRIRCYQLTTETRINIEGKVFLDCTGNGTLSYFAGAEFKTGSEARDELGEPDAPETADADHMGNTILFKAIDVHKPVTFRTPDWIYSFTEEDLKTRKHGNADVANDPAFGSAGPDYGYWWNEHTGFGGDIIDEYEKIRDDLVRTTYGLWDHLKNGGEHGASTYTLDWVGMLPGTRESRRFIGEYMLNENDCLTARVFPDAVAYGGWSIDRHSMGGIFNKEEGPSFLRKFDGLYTIPYRAYVNRDLDNLYVGGRALSASRLAMASTRVMGTCAVGGQAMGTAAAMCIRYDCRPIEILDHMKELQQILLKNDCYLPGYRNEDALDLARNAVVTASSEMDGSPAVNVINGVSRNEHGTVINAWESEGLAGEGECLTLLLARPAAVREVRLTFDSNLNIPIKVTLSDKRRAIQRIGVPCELVKDYEVELLKDGSVVEKQTVKGNYQRHNIIAFPTGILCDSVRVRILSTNGYENAKVFEVRIYE